MNILCKTTGVITQTGKSQLGMCFKKEIVDNANISKGQKYNVTVLEDESILIQKVK